MALVLSGSIDISGSMTATTIIVSAPGAAGMVSSSQQVQNYFTFAKTGSANTFYGNQTITGSLFISGSGGSPSSQAVQIIRDTLGNGTVVEESNMALTILSAPGQTKLAMGASNAGNYGYIQAMQDGTSWTNRSLTLQPRGGDVTITNGNLVVASGKGIDFSATSNGSGTTSSELLNDYEEGTWTPVIVGGITAGAGTYSQQIGKYTKVGNVVHIYFALAWSAHTGTGKTIVTGFPFASAAAGQTPFAVFTYGETMTAGNVPNGGIMSTGTTQWEHWQIPTGGGASTGIPIYNGTGEIQVSGTYIA